jgi:NAD(P)-dependent dehydrogenase (short-subunit alcohol dehydrogenase family)
VIGNGKNTRPEIVVVTGASAGVGRATVREFARHGAWLGLIARDRGRLEAARREVEATGGRALVLSADVADDDQVEEAAESVERHLGPIDVWINNAMVSVFSPISRMTAEEFRRVTEVTYLGYVYGTLAALRRMRPRDRGVIVQVGSALAYRGIPLQAAYCGAKHAVQGFTDSLRCELLHDGSGVRVVEVHLPALNTPQFGWVKSRLPRAPQPVPPIYQPEVAARAIVWASERNRRQVWVGGSTVATILANRLMPGVLDHYLGRTNVQAQQTGEPVDPDRPDNLFSPAPGDPGAHGIFDDQAHPRSVQLTLAEHRRALGLAGLTAAAGAAAAGILARMR